MVSCDNTAFLLTQLRTAFVGGDDTGVCELLIDKIRVCDEDVLALFNPPGASQSQMSLLDQSDPFVSTAPSASDSQASLAGEAHSPDIIPPKLEGQQSRKKSTTQQRVTAAREERQKEKKTVLSVEWSDDVSGLTDGDIDYLFPAPTELEEETANSSADAAVVAGSGTKRLSLLARRLTDNAESVVENPFTEFSQFEVSLSRQGLRKIRVHFYDLDRTKAVDVMPIRDTTVEQFIGLACYKYIFDGHKPPLPNHIWVDDLDLYMYEETDDLDSDFPPLEKRDRIYKYEFSSLAVVQKHSGVNNHQNQQQHQPAASDNALHSIVSVAGGVRRPSTSGQVIVHVSLPQGFTTMQLDRCVPVGSLLEKIVRRRKLKEHRGHKYVLRRADDASVDVPLDAPLGEAGTTEFILVRENSTPAAQAAAQSAADAALMPFGAPGADAATSAAAGTAAAAANAGGAAAASAAAASSGAGRRSDVTVGGGGDGPSHLGLRDTLDSLALRQYRLQLRGVINRDVMLSVSGDCIVLDFLGSKTKLFSKRSPSSYGWDSVAGCQLEERPGSSKATVHLYYKSATSPTSFGGSLSSLFHCLLLEGSDTRLLRELHAQVNNILMLRGGSARKVFLELVNK